MNYCAGCDDHERCRVVGCERGAPRPLSIRDQLAMAALPSLGGVFRTINPEHSANRIAAFAYMIADAMLRARD